MDSTKLLRSNIILYCGRWEETVGFYRDRLGFPIENDFGWMIEFRLTEDSFLSIANENRGTIESSKGRGITITLEVENLNDLYTILQGRGIESGGMKDHESGYRHFFLHDPEGSRIEFWSRTCLKS